MGGLADHRSAAIAFAALTMLFAGDQAAAITKEQAMDKCREKFRPVVQACVKKQVQQKGGSPKAFVESCRSAQAEPFRACVSKIIATSAPAAPQAPQETPVDLSQLKLNRASGF